MIRGPVDVVVQFFAPMFSQKKLRNCLNFLPVYGL